MREYGCLLETEFGRINGNSNIANIKGVTMHQEKDGGVRSVWVSVEKDNKIDRDAGEYATFYIEDFNIGASKKIVEKLGSAIKEMCGEGARRALFLGMGNSEIISDTLGIKTLELLDMAELTSINTECRFAKFCPGVFAVSGFQSFEIVQALTSIFMPDVLIVVDSLCAGSVDRLGNCFQITNAGITPGSAVGGNMAKISSETLGGVKVISIGVPVVIYLQSVIEEVTKKIKPLEKNLLEVLDVFDGIFSPKDIDKIINFSSEIISSAIKKAFI